MLGKNVRLFFSVFLVAVLIMPLQAQAADEAENFVNNISSKVVSIINDGAMDDKQKEKELEILFNKHVDTQWMAGFVLGKYKRTTSPELMKKYLELYHVYLVRSYVPRFKEYGSRDFKILRITQSDDNNYLVKMKLEGLNGQPDILVDYRLHKGKDGELRLTDVIGEGVSMVTTQRADFGGLISRKGMEYFLEKLEQKVNKLLEGS